MQLNKKLKRLKRAKKTRAHIKSQAKPRLVVNKSNKHIYAQIIESTAGHSDVVVCSASTAEKEIKTSLGSVVNNIEAAKKVGALVAKRGLEKKLSKIAFDRSGYKYHGGIKALADAAREAGLDF